MYFSSFLIFSPCQDPLVSMVSVVSSICIDKISPSHAVKLAAAANLWQMEEEKMENGKYRKYEKYGKGIQRYSKSFVISLVKDIKGMTWS